MKDYSKISKLGIITSSIALIITTINLVYSIIKGNDLFTSIIIFFSMITAFVSNILIAEESKKKSDKNNKY